MKAEDGSIIDDKIIRMPTNEADTEVEENTQAGVKSAVNEESQETLSAVEEFARSIETLIQKHVGDYAVSYSIAPYATAYTIVAGWNDLADKLIQKSIRDVSLACKAGCSKCCYQLTGAPEIYAMAIAHTLSGNTNGKNPSWIYNQLRKFARKSDNLMATIGYDSISVGNNDADRIKMESQAYIKRQIACPFLDKRNMCIVYSLRPPACRLHYVVGDNEACHGTGTAQPVVMPPIVYKIAYAPSAIYRGITGRGNIVRPFQRMVFAHLNKIKGKKQL